MKVLVISSIIVLACSSLAGEELRCVEVPQSLFHEVTSVFPDGLPEDARIAGAGRTLGVLVPSLPEGHHLYLLRGGRRHSKLWLPTPKERPFPSRPDFHLGDNGNLVGLRVREFFAVYAGATLTAVIDLGSGGSLALGDRLYWAPAPTSTLPLHGPDGDRTELAEDRLPPLLVQSELDGTRQRVLLRVDEKRLKEDDSGFPLYQTLYPALRSDRKLWLAGRFSGEIMVAESNGTIRQRFNLAEHLIRPEDDPESQSRHAEREEKIAAQIEAIRTRRASDATRRRSGEGETAVFARSPHFSRAFPRGRDLVLVMATANPPPGTIALVKSDLQNAYCFRLPDSLGSDDHPALRFAVTEDALWLRQPFGYIQWFDIERLLDPEEDEEDSEDDR